MRKPLAAAALAALLFASCAKSAPAEDARTEFVLGTVCTVRILSGGDGKALDDVFSRLRQIEDRMSANKDGTEIAAVNAAAGAAPVKVSPDTLFVVMKGLDYARLTGGAVDPTVGPLVKLWGIGTEAARVPAPAEIQAAKRLVDWRKVRVDEAARTVFLEQKGMALDLGSFAKGYAADEAKRILGEHKVKGAIVDLGGNVFAQGVKKDGTDWRVGVQDPATDRGEYLGIVSGKDITVTTAGVYERFFEVGGKRYHHILDPKTGAPAETGLLSVTLVTRSSTLADGLDTALFVLGREKGMALAATLPDIEVIMVDADRRVWLSPGAAKIFRMTGEGYKLAE